MAVPPAYVNVCERDTQEFTYSVISPLSHIIILTGGCIVFVSIIPMSARETDAGAARATAEAPDMPMYVIISPTKRPAIPRFRA